MSLFENASETLGPCIHCGRGVSEHRQHPLDATAFVCFGTELAEDIAMIERIKTASELREMAHYLNTNGAKWLSGKDAKRLVDAVRMKRQQMLYLYGDQLKG